MLEREKVTIQPSGEIKRQSIESQPSKEVDTWLQKIEKGDIYLSKPVINDQTGQTLVTSPSAQNPTIVLPLTKQQLIFGLKQKVSDAIRWLAEWCLRLIKMHPENIKLKTS